VKGEKKKHRSAREGRGRGKEAAFLLSSRSSRGRGGEKKKAVHFGKKARSFYGHLRHSHWLFMQSYPREKKEKWRGAFIFSLLAVEKEKRGEEGERKKKRGRHFAHFGELVAVGGKKKTV